MHLFIATILMVHCSVSILVNFDPLVIFYNTDEAIVNLIKAIDSLTPLDII